MWSEGLGDLRLLELEVGQAAESLRRAQALLICAGMDDLPDDDSKLNDAGRPYRNFQNP